jgi:hypothetical protein
MGARYDDAYQGRLICEDSARDDPDACRMPHGRRGLLQ